MNQTSYTSAKSGRPLTKKRLSEIAKRTKPKTEPGAGRALYDSSKIPEGNTRAMLAQFGIVR